MDWPPCDRPDWDTSNPLWTEADIARQRLEGKFVFAQPMRNDDPLDVVTTTGNPTSRLPVPTGGGWIDAITYLVTPPRVMTLRSATTGTQKTFTRVSSATALGPGKFYCPNLGAYDASSRIIEFGEAMVDDQWTVVRPDGTPTFVTYTICDLQPKDTVVATYSSKAMLDLALTVSRKDYAARTPETSRQDFNVTRSIEAKNAAKRARRDDR